VHRKHLHETAGSSSVADLGHEVKVTVEPQATLRDALQEMLLSNSGSVVVVDGTGRFQGVLAIETLTAVIHRMRREAREHYEQLAAADPEHHGHLEDAVAGADY
jgi:CBS domain-containing protein